MLEVPAWYSIFPFQHIASSVGALCSIPPSYLGLLEAKDLDTHWYDPHVKSNLACS
jgi:hypothetical protein